MGEVMRYALCGSVSWMGEDQESGLWVRYTDHSAAVSALEA